MLLIVFSYESRHYTVSPLIIIFQLLLESEMNKTIDRFCTCYKYLVTNFYFKSSLVFDSKWAIWAGSNSILTNGIDYAKWMNFHLNNGKDKSGSPLLNANSFAYLHAPHNLITSTGKYFRQPLVPVTTADTSYAFGWKNGYYHTLLIYSIKGYTNAI